MSKVTRVMKLKLEPTKVKSEILLSIAKKYRQELNRMLYDLSFLSRDKLDHFRLYSKVKFSSDFSVGFSQEALIQACGLLKGSFKTRKKIPKVKSLSFNIDKNLARLEKSTNEKSKFVYFLNCSTIVKHKRIVIPVAPLTDFQKERMSQIKHGWVVKYYPESKSWFLLVPYFVEVKKEDSQRSQRSLGIDVGFSTLIATSDGDLIGENWSQLESKISDSLTKKNKARNKLRALCKKSEVEKENNSQSKATAKAKKIKKHNLGKRKYDATSQRQKSQVKSEINHAVKELFTRDFDTLVLENLQSMGGGPYSGAKVPWELRLNRLLSSWKRGDLKQAITLNAQLNSVQLQYVNPAYTSKTCLLCGWVSDSNRKSQSEFACTNPLCVDFGHKKHADINASQNVLARGDDPELGSEGLWRYPATVRQILTRRFQSDAMAHPGLESGKDQISRVDSFNDSNDVGISSVVSSIDSVDSTAFPAKSERETIRNFDQI